MSAHLANLPDWRLAAHFSSFRRAVIAVRTQSLNSSDVQKGAAFRSASSITSSGSAPVLRPEYM